MLRILLLVVAVVSGGAAAWLAMQMRPQAVVVAQPAPAPRAAAPAPVMAEVLVASGDLRPAQRLGKENMRWQAWPQEFVNSLHITRAERPDAVELLAGKLLRTHVINGDPIRSEHLLRVALGTWRRSYLPVNAPWQ